MTPSELIGEGDYGSVYCGLDNDTIASWPSSMCCLLDDQCRPKARHLQQLLYSGLDNNSCLMAVKQERRTVCVALFGCCAAVAAAQCHCRVELWSSSARAAAVARGGGGKAALVRHYGKPWILTRVQVRVPRAAAIRGKVAAHLNGLEADIAVLRRLQHPNIVRYLVSCS